MRPIKNYTLTYNKHCLLYTSLNRLEQGEYHRIMVLATGALLSPVAVQQKGTIPCIAHGIVYERSE